MNIQVLSNSNGQSLTELQKVSVLKLDYFSLFLLTVIIVVRFDP